MTRDFSLRVKARIKPIVKSNANDLSGEVISLEEIPKYKFYTNLIFDLLELNQLYGANPKDILKSLKKGLLKDGEIDRKVAKEIRGTILNFFIISIISWSLSIS
ncbi:MAG: hypothetical protein HQK51_14470 [Oligoflexia bacterium]|nr:hypothetical protein [Oligoflexia bacterium]